MYISISSEVGFTDCVDHKNVIKPLPAAPSIKKTCPDPVTAVSESQMALLDPTGVRRRMFDYKNREGAKVGDVLHTTFKSGEPFSGVIMSIKSRKQDTSVLLRNHLTRVGAEMSIKVFSPNVSSMEIVQRTQKRKRRARLYYLRKPKHDVGSVQRVVDQYVRQKAALTGNRVVGRTPQGKGKRNTKR